MEVWMSFHLKRVGIIGSGVMGSGIAAQLANAGVASLILDIAPASLTKEEEALGLSLSDRKVKNRITEANLQQLMRAKPAQLFEPDLIRWIEAGNIDDDFERLSEVDWIIEAVPERLDLKRATFERLEKILKPSQIISSNTSGISLREMLEGRSRAFRERFLVTHFFNPPRYLRLLEVIPCPETDPEVVATIAKIGARVLGKGIVYARDTPNFIANRIGLAEFTRVLHTVEEKNYTVEEVDALTGKLIGRPKSGFFRLMDIVGLDTLINNSKYLAESLQDDPVARYLRLPSYIERMMELNLRGEKTQAGFYKRVGSGAKKEIHSLDLKSFEYHPQAKPSLPSLETAKGIEDLPARLRAMVKSTDRGGEFVWNLLSSTLDYAATVAPSISEDILNIDRAMRWGFNWQLGPFQIWDALGVRDVADRLKSESRPVPGLVEELLSKGYHSFYQVHDHHPTYFDFSVKEHRALDPQPGVIELAHVRLNPTHIIRETEVASLLDLGDGVACIEFHSKMNTLSSTVIDLMLSSLDLVEEQFEAVLIANQGENFSAGANLVQLLLAAEEQDWDLIDRNIARFQNTSMKIKYLSKPVVACPHGLTLGGAVEFSLHCHRLRAAAETYMGLVECGIGLIPGGAGTKEMAIRFGEMIPSDIEVNRLPFLQRVFEMIGTARVSGSARDAQIMGLLRDHDSWSMNRDCQIHDAKNIALSLVGQGFRPLREKPVKVLGVEGYSFLKVALRNLHVAGHITDHDVVVGEKLAYVLCGGNVPSGTEVTERYLLEIEREAFLQLFGEPRTQDRIRHTLKTGKPLRN